MKSNVVLTGMSGAGKSTLGVLLAKRLGLNFVDTDLLIQRREGRMLQQIIDEDGVERFLQIEESVVANASLERSVIATGGSVVYSDKIMRRLRENGTVVYLYVPFDVLTSRLTNVSTRGIVIKKGNTLKDVYDERLPLYRQYADVICDCAVGGVEECMERVAAELTRA